MRRNASIGREHMQTHFQTTTSPSASEFKQDGEALIEVGSYLFPSRSPSCPDEMDWSVHFPEHFDPPANLGEGSISKKSKRVEWVDIGCGFGGLVCALAPLYPDILMLGMQYLRRCLSTKLILHKHQAWRSECKSRNSCKIRLLHFVGREMDSIKISA